jgi:hypothetical protein
MPFIFQTDPADDDTLMNLNLVYDYEEIRQIDGSWFTDESRYDTLDYVVTHNNMKTLLNIQYYGGVPLAMETESWEINDWISIDSHSARVIESDNLYGYDCWI